MPQEIGGGKIKVQAGDTLIGIYGSDWKKLSGYTGDPTKLQVGTILPSPIASKPPVTTTPAPQTPLTTSPIIGQFGGTPTLPGKYNAYQDGTSSPVSDFSGVQSVADANAIINSNQTADINNAKTTEAVPVRKTVSDVIKEISSTITPSTPKPVAPNYTDAMNTFKTQYGVTDLENQLNTLKTHQDQLYADKQARTNNEKGKTVAMNVIEGRVGEVEQQENERIAAVERSINNVTNQLNTKYNIVDTLMKTKEMDYNTAVTAYDKEMANNISMFNTAKNLLDEEKSELEHDEDTARSNAQIILSSYINAGKTYNTLSESEKVNLTKLGVQSGLGADFFSNVLAVSAGKDILTHIISEDKTKATIMYKDGTTKVVSTGLPASKTSTTGQVTEKDTNDRNNKIVDSFNKDVTDSDLMMKYDSKDAFIKLLQARYPDIDKGDIARKVNEIYTDADFQ